MEIFFLDKILHPNTFSGFYQFKSDLAGGHLEKMATILEIQVAKAFFLIKIVFKAKYVKYDGNTNL